MKLPDHLKEIFTKEEWKSMSGADKIFLSASSWQSPTNYQTNAGTASVLNDYFPFKESDLSKASDLNWRDLQKHAYMKYKVFGPLNAAVDSKADLAVGHGFSIYSEIKELNEFLKELVIRNRLSLGVIGWIVRMQAEGELFVLISIDDNGRASLRALEPERIGDGDDHGLIIDPDDVTQTLFYKHKTQSKTELIPDYKWILYPEMMAEREKALRSNPDPNVPYDPSLIADITKGRKGKLGGYRRFVFHWKNLTGIHEYKRDTASLSTSLEWVNMYIQALKWQQDYKKALCAYTIEIKFSDTPGGKLAWLFWGKMTEEQKAATNLTRPLTPGSKIFIMPGMEIRIHAPVLSAMQGNNEELLNLSGAGARTPQDLFQGQSGGTTYASVKSSRPPLQAEVENIQWKTMQVLKYDILRACVKAALAYGGTFLACDGKTKYKLLEQYTEPWIGEVKDGKAVPEQISVDPCEKIMFTFPKIRLVDDAKETGNLLLGSKHSGAYGLGVSGETIGKWLGIDDFAREKRRQLIEQSQFGIPMTGADAERIQEAKPSNSSQPEQPPVEQKKAKATENFRRRK